MGKRIDLIGKRIGCLTVLSIAESKKVKSGSRGYWNCICDCGEVVKKGAPKLVRTLQGKESSPRYCSATCKCKNVNLKCECGKEISVPVFRANRIKKISNKWTCRECSAKKVGLKNIGKIASNRLPNSQGGFNSLFGSYKKSANERGILFNLSKEEFAVFTKEDCHYCGTEPNSNKWSNGNKEKQLNAPPYVYNGLDRVDSSKGYEIGNIVACCATCNRMKLDHEYNFFIEHIEKISMNMTLKSIKTRAPGNGHRTFLP